ncbi:RNI-like protein [Pleurotus eryngii]|uniref:RNI-like protein n=1 Tax=Pleurotus eryngii TaxID=5323 RepID=A0A9P6DDW3_PLEER|nr:RNI-like protein [Pleurotus eryngii]
MNSRGTSHRPRAALANTSAPSLKAKTSTHFTGSPRSKLPNVPNKHDDSLTTPSVSAQAMSIREAIALKRAEARKAMENRSRSVGINDPDTLEDALPTVTTAPKEDDDILGRDNLREVIERAKSTGSVNFAARSLPCIPSGLFEIHLGVTPERLASVTEEPALPPPDDKATSRRRGGRDVPAWYDAQDLHVLKAGNNDIIEIQPEISMFGSLKNIDLHKNRIASLPDTFADLASLTYLDLSHNRLTSLPRNVFALPELATLNISHNELGSLPFSSPFVNTGPRSRPNQGSGSFFMPTITRSTTPLPRLTVLDASHNQIVGDAIDIDFPSSIVKLDLSSNPLSSVKPELLDALAALQKLRELRLEKAEVTNSVFHAVPFSAPNFPALRVIDVGETQVTVEAAQAAFGALGRHLSFEAIRDEPPEGVLQVLVGKRVLREAWEIEIEKRANRTKAKVRNLDESAPTPADRAEAVREAWEIEAERGLLTEGGRRRERAAAANAATLPDAREKNSQTSPTSRASSPPKPSVSVLNNAQYYTPAAQTLSLPPSVLPTKPPGHSRTFSAAFPSNSRSGVSAAPSTDVIVPTPTLPLALIAQQPFAHTLRTLVLNKRRLDKSFDLPFFNGPCLPCLEELNIAGCDLSDSISVAQHEMDTTVPPSRTSEPLLPLIAKLFPSLKILDLSYNVLTNASLQEEILTRLILSDATANLPRKGLTHFRLQGNRISDVGGFADIAQLFKGNRDVPAWHMEELDIRDNEVAKLPPELGLLPLDVFLVDGNVFRVPQRRVWEREGTKGLLSWLRGRIE